MPSDSCFDGRSDSCFDGRSVSAAGRSVSAAGSLFEVFDRFFDLIEQLTSTEGESSTLASLDESSSLGTRLDILGDVVVFRDFAAVFLSGCFIEH